MSRCKCAGGDSRGGNGLVGGHQFFSEKKNISSSFICSLSFFVIEVKQIKLILSVLAICPFYFSDVVRMFEKYRNI